MGRSSKKHHSTYVNERHLDLVWCLRNDETIKGLCIRCMDSQEDLTLSSVQISVIIPTYQEEANIGSLLSHLMAADQHGVCEFIVVDGGSTDRTVKMAQDAGATVYPAAKKGRNHQMNLGAAKANGEIFYFVHADTLPPTTYIDDIHESLEEGHCHGCYRFRFNKEGRRLRFNAWFTRFNRMWCRGGDQTLYVTRDLFTKLGGYCEEFIIMEEYDFLRRAKAQASFRIMPKEVVVSARKYEKNSYLRVNAANLMVFVMFRLGFSPVKMHTFYRRMVHRSN